MHPVNYLFDEIMRHYWGIPQRDLDARKDDKRTRRAREVPAWRLPRFRPRDDLR